MKGEETSFSIRQLVDIIDVIRKLRNDLIKDFLDERVLISYWSARFKNVELTAQKSERIKIDLKNLLITPVNIELYSSIIEDYKTTGNTSVSKDNEKLFYQDVDKILNIHIY